MATAGDPGAPLAGVRVLDCSRALAGPYAAMTLADLGADVIKLERPGVGDDARAWLPIVDGESCYFAMANAGKRSLELDLGDPAASRVLRALVMWADVLVENFRPGALARLGYPADRLAAWNPRLVHCSITAYGTDGPSRDRPGMDLLLQASEGLMSITGEEGRPPVRVGIPIADLIASANAVHGILASLLLRERSGHGGRVEIALQDGLLAWMGYFVTSHLMTGTTPRRWGAAHPALAPYGAYATADGWLVLAAGTDGLWAALAAALGLDELVADPRFADNPARVAHRDELDRLLADRFRDHPAGVWADRLTADGVPCSAVRSLPEALVDPSVAARGLIETVGRPDGTAVPLVASPVHLGGVPASSRRPPPRLGEHTREILDALGLSAAPPAAGADGPPRTG